MSQPAYFENAADYHDWWFFSGTALGAVSPGETFAMLHEQLSEAGANIVVAARFLDENERGIDVRLWRGAFVFGHVGRQVALTIQALDAIGAAGVVRAFRTSPAPADAPGLAQSMLETGRIDSEAIARLKDELRGNIAAAASYVLGEVPEGLRAAIPVPRPAEGVESVGEVRGLLDAYVAANQDDLARDVARYGDPRKQPGFDPDRAREERARRVDRVGYHRYQRGAIDGLREKLDSLKTLAAKEPAESPALNKVLRKVLDEYKGFSRRPPGDLIPEVDAWLRDVAQFRDAHPDVPNPRVTQDDRVNSRLAAIGPHVVSLGGPLTSITWRTPEGLPCDWTEFDLAFHLTLEKKPDPARVVAALDSLCDEWARLQERWATLVVEIERYVIEFFRNVVADNLADEEREEYEEEDGHVSDERILDGIKGGTVILTRSRASDEPAQIEVYFSTRWDDEHGLEVHFDDAGEILRWF